MKDELKELLSEVELETKCDYCDGKGGESLEGSGNWHRCGMCNGSGFVATGLGEKILRLIRHNFKAMLEDVGRLMDD